MYFWYYWLVPGLLALLVCIWMVWILATLLLIAKVIRWFTAGRRSSQPVLSEPDQAFLAEVVKDL